MRPKTGTANLYNFVLQILLHFFLILVIKYFLIVVSLLGIYLKNVFILFCKLFLLRIKQGHVGVGCQVCKFWTWVLSCK